MASNDGIYVRLGADSTELQAAFAKAETALQSLSGKVQGTAAATAPLSEATRKVTEQYDRAFGALRKGGEAFQAVTEALARNEITATQAARSLAGIEAAAAKAAGGHEQLSLATAGARRELIVLGHEAVSGNWTRFGPSLMVLAERMGGVSLGAMAMGGAVAVAGYGLYELLAHANATERTLINVQTAFAAVGNAARMSDADIRAAIFNLAQLPGITQSAAEEIVTAFARTRQIGGEMFQALTGITEQFARATGKDATQAAADLARAFANPAEGAKTLDGQLGILTASQLQHITVTQRESGVVAAQRELYAALSARLAQLPEGMTRVESGANRLGNAVDRLMHAFANNGAIDSFLGKLSIVTKGLASWLDPTPADKYEQALSRVAEAKKKLEISQKSGNIIMIDAWTRALAKYNAEAVKAKDAVIALQNPAGPKGTDQESDADANKRVLADTSGLVAPLERIRALKSQIAELDKRASETGDNGIAADLRARADEARRQLAEAQKPAGGASQMQTWRAQLADQQAASEANKAQMLRDEVAFWEARKQLAKAGSAESVEVERAAAQARIALRKEEDSERKRTAKEKQDIDKIDANAGVEIAKIKLQAERERLDGEVAAGRITEAEKVALLQKETEAVTAKEDAILAAEVAGLTKGTTAYEQSYQKRQVLAEQHKAEMQRLATQGVQAEQKAAQQTAQSWERALAPVERAFDTSIQGMVTGTQTLHQAVARMGASIVAEEISSDTRWLAHKAVTNALGLQSDKGAAEGGLLAWILAENKKTVATTAGTGTRVLTTNAGQARETAAVTGAQTTQTGATVAGNAARNAADASSQVGFFGRIAEMLARWLGLETAKTGATVGEDGARALADGGAAAASIAAAKAEAVGEIPAYAAIAGAAAVQSAAAIPYVGWAMAPEAGAANFKAAMAFMPMASAAGGMERVPTDGMLFELHRNETVLPASFATPLRSFIGALPAMGLPAGFGAPANGNSPAAAPAAAAPAPAGGGGDTHFHIHANDAASFVNMARRNSNGLVGAINSAVATGAAVRTITGASR